jgi:hypothetical protein
MKETLRKADSRSTEKTPFMELKNSLLRSQQPATGTYSELVESNPLPHTPISSLQIFNIQD